jgi:hypothetical protein
MRFFVFQLFLVSLLLSVTGCQKENPEITQLDTTTPPPNQALRVVIW